MSAKEIARAAQRLRDDDSFQNVIAEIQADQTKVFLNASSTDEQLAEARQLVVALAAIQRKITGLIGRGITADKMKGQHRGSD